MNDPNQTPETESRPGQPSPPDQGRCVLQCGPYNQILPGQSPQAQGRNITTCGPHNQIHPGQSPQAQGRNITTCGSDDSNGLRTQYSACDRHQSPPSPAREITKNGNSSQTTTKTNVGIKKKQQKRKPHNKNKKPQHQETQGSAPKDPPQKHPNKRRNLNDPNKGKEYLTEILQQNLHNEIGATKEIMNKLQLNTILALQEPYTGEKRCRTVKGIPKNAQCFATTSTKPKACIIMSKEMAKNAIKLGSVSNEELVSVRYKYNKQKPIIITSAYLAAPKGQSEINEDTRKKLEETYQLTIKNNWKWIILTDGNGRNLRWNDKTTNQRGKILETIIDNCQLYIENKGNTPTYNSSTGKSIIDLTLTNSNAHQLIKEWEIQKTILSDHEILRTTLNLGNVRKQTTRLIKNMDIEVYTQKLKEKMEKGKKTKDLTTEEDMNREYDFTTKCMIEAFKEATPLTTTTHHTKTPWNAVTTGIRDEIKTLKRIKDKNDNIRQEIKTLKHRLSTEIKTEEKTRWRREATEIQTNKEAAKRCKYGNKSKERLSELKKEGNFTNNPKETLHILANTLIPKEENKKKIDFTKQNKQKKEVKAEEVIKDKYLNKACKMLKKAKAPGPDNIRNELITTGL
eukprot:sb/3463019/